MAANGSAVAIPREMQAALKLDPGAAPTTEDPSKAHYLVAGYHTMHCMHVVRDSIYYLNGTLKEWPGPGPFLESHLLHCIEAVRQALACSMDPTLIPLDNVWPGIPNGQLHVCRNSEALYRWTNRYGHATPEFTATLEGPHTEEWLERKKIMKQTSADAS
ncbi:hypothetical protein OHC33_000406 [Knufia fluminis]|uniref:Tat pathway signal sequence n=1 Tax=Knufia fluminis TaxID=191047 RepID=A0AAN8EMJ9_9EURO|nr:hypothetical protein OHC33_000406 [Knufia fluminis]